MKHKDDLIEIDYNSIGLKVGLEIHQQLNTIEKLHCHCENKTYNIESYILEFTRYLHPKSDINGKMDEAAIEQTKANRIYKYKTYPNTCLVELDEGDPFPIDKEALEVALIVSKYLKMDIADTIYTMRKIIVDGSTTSGFQRTSQISANGHLNTKYGTSKIGSLCLEEDSSTSINMSESETTYSLDRLGIPLIEIATEPDINTPSQAYEVAKKIGMMLRSTKRVRRGIGSIRQDVNVSIASGNRVEIKGVQNLELIPKLIDMEIERQINLLSLKDMFIKNNVRIEKNCIHDCTSIFRNTKSKIIKKSIENNGSVLSIILKNGRGMLGYYIQEGRRFGTELSDRAKALGISGIFHTDELPKYGITKEEIDSIYKYTKSNTNDCILIITGIHEKIINVLESIIDRVEYVSIGVPKETRKALENGTTSYLRPLPGPSRMYPETDLAPVEIKTFLNKTINIPELISDKINRYKKTYNINEDVAEKIAYSDNVETFEKLVDDINVLWNPQKITYKMIANIFVNIFQELKRNNLNIKNVDYLFIKDILSEINCDKISKEAIGEILHLKCEDKNRSISECIEYLSLGKSNNSDIFNLLINDIRNLIFEKKEFIFDLKEHSITPLMGLLMKNYRGKIDGKKINDILKEEVYKVLKME